jgi:hypothetical protein
MRSDSMDSVSVKNLNDPSTWNRWIVGTLEDVPESSARAHRIFHHGILMNRLSFNSDIVARAKVLFDC